MKENIAIIIRSLNSGGAERTASNLSVFLSGFYNVHMIVFDGSDIKYPVSGSLHDLKLKPSHFITVKQAQAVKEIKKKHDIKYSISFMDGANLVNVLSRHRDKTVTSVRIHMSSSRKTSKLLWIKTRAKMSFISRKSDCIVAISRGVKDDLIDNFRVSSDKIKTIYNPCDAEMLRSLAEKKHGGALELNKNSITTMGRMMDQKGQWHLLRAMKKVLESVPDAFLYILGDGPLRSLLEDLINDLGLSDNVKLLGYVEAPHAYIAGSKVFVFPSLMEGLGNVLLEAMAFGVPCIASDCKSGPREIISPLTDVIEHLPSIEYAEYGVLTSVCGKGQKNAEEPLTKEEEQLAEAIVKLLTDEQLHKQYSEKSLERSKFFLPERIAGNWKNLIENLNSKDDN